MCSSDLKKSSEKRNKHRHKGTPGSPPAQGSARCSRNVALALWPSGQRASDRRLAGPACTLAAYAWPCPSSSWGPGKHSFPRLLTDFDKKVQNIIKKINSPESFTVQPVRRAFPAAPFSVYLVYIPMFGITTSIKKALIISVRKVLIR